MYHPLHCPEHHVFCRLHQPPAYNNKAIILTSS
jgi:hypothetical protein